jgi:hypothetical protein
VGLVVVLLAERFAIADIPECWAHPGIVAAADLVLAQKVRERAFVMAL